MGAQTGTWTPTKRRGPIAAEFTTPGPAALSLPSSFGSSGPASKTRAPAFTISGRHEPKIESAGPGPGQYNINGLSYKAGKDEAHAPSMHIRPKDPKVYITPAPGDYSPEKATKVLDGAPRFSFGIKVDLGKDAGVPAPNSYNIPNLIGSNKVAAHETAPAFTMSGRPGAEEDKMKVPGPGSYNDAIVDKYKTIKSPAFSMGQRTNIPADHTKKPGPGAHSPEKFFEEYFKGHQYTIPQRPNDPKPNRVPGPGTYNANLDVCLETRPIYTIRPKTELPKDKTPRPAPNTYNPMKCLEEYFKGPEFTIAPRPNDPKKMKVPGPGTYNANLDICLERRPVYTMSTKTELPTDKTRRPAPNTYNPMKSLEEYYRGPLFTIAPRPNDPKPKNVPGPGTYNANLDICLERRPLYTMSPKTDLPTDKTPRPAPNTYNPMKSMEEYFKGPQFSMATRPNDPKPMNIPGPGTYNANRDICLETRPVYSMAPKTELPTDKTPRPAPNTYSPEKSMEEYLKGPQYTMATRPNDPKPKNIPGPGSYNANIDICLETRPVYSMFAKTDLPTDKTPRPAPNTYSPEKSMEEYLKGPQYTMATRPNDPKPKNIPGPGTYNANIDICLETRPVYSMFAKTDLPTDKTPRPAPNTYSPEKSMEEYLKGPQFTMAPRPNDPKPKNVPGPATYDANLDVCFETRPVYTMSTRTELPFDKTPKPAPNAYCPEKNNDKKTPEFSFGVKHSLFLGKLRTK